MNAEYCSAAKTSTTAATTAAATTDEDFIGSCRDAPDAPDAPASFSKSQVCRVS